jgi:hypothetical protein
VGNHLVVWLPRAPQTRLIRAANSTTCASTPRSTTSLRPPQDAASAHMAALTDALPRTRNAPSRISRAVGASMVLLVAPIEERDLAAPTASDLVSRTPATELRLGAPAARGPDRVD